MSQAARRKRPRYLMPSFIHAALVETALLPAYRARPPYQRNDYVGWITRARRPDTRDRRLSQMLGELARGDRYMKMALHPRTTRS
jgi:uncharacterized protein YdeI (YjbR/CyaY-like superfamily)